MMKTILAVIGLISVILFLILFAAALIVWPEFTKKENSR